MCGCFVQKIDMSKICGVSIKIISFGFLFIENKECQKILTVTHVQNAAFLDDTFSLGKSTNFS